MRKNIVNEDFSAPGGQYMQLTGTTEGPRKVNLLDIVNFQKYLEDETTRAPKTLPAPMNGGMVDQIGDIYIAANTIQSELHKVLANPLVVDDKEVQKTLKKMYKKFSHVKMIIKSVSNDLDQLEMSGS